MSYAPGAGPVHPHRRRAAHLQLPAVAARVHRALLHRPAVARLRRRGARRGDRVVPEPRAALRPHERAGAGGAAPAYDCHLEQPMLKTRILTAAVLIPARAGGAVPAAAAWRGRCVDARADGARRVRVGAARRLPRVRRAAVRRRRRCVIGLRLLFSPAAGFARGWPDAVVLAVCGIGGAVLGRRRAAVGDRTLAARSARRRWRSSAGSCCSARGWRWSSCRRARRGSCSRRWRSCGSPTPPRTSPGARSAAASSRRR